MAREVCGGGVAGVEEDAVFQAEGFVGFEDVGRFEVEGGARPAVVAAMPAGGEVWIVGMIHEGDAAPFVLRDGTGLVEPFAVGEMGAAFVESAFGGANFAGAIEDGHRLRDTRGEETEAGFAEGDSLHLNFHDGCFY